MAVLGFTLHSHTPHREAGLRTTPASILVVEDEPVIALDIEQRLLQLGYQVVAIADCAEDVLAIVRQSQPDLVLMDIQLQGDIDGITVATELRNRFKLAVVFLTAHADEATLDRAIAAQPYGYIVKPFQTHDLSTAIEIAISRHRAELAIEAALEQEKELNELKSRFVSIVSHEFRNPLNVILFSIDLLTHYEEQLTPEKKQTYFTRARDAVLRMHELLEKVLVIGKAEAGKLECHPAPLNVLKFCQELLEEIKAAPETQPVIVFTADDCTMTQPLYLLDENLLRHILSNLLSNAIKYSPLDSEVEFTLTCEADTIIFCVRDRGIGIPIEDQVRLFDSFHRAGNVHKIPGTGLGLSIVKQCVDAHRGDIDVQSEVGAGSTFTVKLYQELD